MQQNAIKTVVFVTFTEKILHLVTVTRFEQLVRKRTLNHLAKLAYSQILHLLCSTHAVTNVMLIIKTSFKLFTFPSDTLTPFEDLVKTLS